MRETIIFSVLIASVLLFALTYKPEPVIVEKVVEKLIEKPVVVEKFIEKPVVIREGCEIRDSPSYEQEEDYGEVDNGIKELEKTINELKDEPCY